MVPLYSPHHHRRITRKKRPLVTSTVLLMLLFAESAFADSVVQVWTCTLRDGKTGEELIAVSEAWLKAAKTMDGGAELQGFLEFPLAATAGSGGFNFVLVAADAKTWGLFNNDYQDSPAADADEAWNEVAECSASSLWDSIDLE